MEVASNFLFYHSSELFINIAYWLMLYYLNSQEQASALASLVTADPELNKSWRKMDEIWFTRLIGKVGKLDFIFPFFFPLPFGCFFYPLAS